MYEKMTQAYDAMSAVIMSQNGTENAAIISVLEEIDHARTKVYGWLLDNRHLREAA